MTQRKNIKNKYIRKNFTIHPKKLEKFEDFAKENYFNFSQLIINSIEYYINIKNENTTKDYNNIKNENIILKEKLNNIKNIL